MLDLNQGVGGGRGPNLSEESDPNGHSAGAFHARKRRPDSQREGNPEAGGAARGREGRGARQAAGGGGSRKARDDRPTQQAVGTERGRKSQVGLDRDPARGAQRPFRGA